MFTLSKESEMEIGQKILSLVSSYLDNYKINNKELGLLTSKQIKEELGIGHKTLIQWEKAGLKRYVPPINDSRKFYYKTSDILIFLGGNL